MAKLNAAARKRLPSSDFALPGKGKGESGKGSGSYPIPDESHARNALARSANKSPAVKAAVRRKVHAKFPGIKVKGAKGNLSRHLGGANYHEFAHGAPFTGV